jgi:hypothetical protein
MEQWTRILHLRHEPSRKPGDGHLVFRPDPCGKRGERPHVLWTSLHLPVCFEVGRFVHSLNLRGQRVQNVVPANGCLATLLMRWSQDGIEDSSLDESATRRENTSPHVVGNLRFPLTFTYHGRPCISRPCISRLGCTLTNRLI